MAANNPKSVPTHPPTTPKINTLVITFVKSIKCFWLRKLGYEADVQIK